MTEDPDYDNDGSPNHASLTPWDFLGGHPGRGPGIPAGTRIHHHEHTVELDAQWDEIRHWDSTPYGHIAVTRADGTLHHYWQPPTGVANITARWIRERQWTTPGWTGTLTQRAPGTPPLIMRSRGNASILLYDGWDHSDARIMSLRSGRWVDDGPAWEQDPDPPPAYRLPIAWDNPLADPPGDLERAARDTPG